MNSKGKKYGSGSSKGPLLNATRKSKSPVGVDSSPSKDNTVKIPALADTDKKIARAAAEGVRSTSKKQRKSSKKPKPAATPEKTGDAADHADTPFTGASGSKKSKPTGAASDTRDILNTRAKGLKKSKTAGAVSYNGGGSGTKCTKRPDPMDISNLLKKYTDKENQKPKQLSKAGTTGNVSEAAPFNNKEVEILKKPDAVSQPDVAGTTEDNAEDAEKAAAALKIQGAFRGLKARRAQKQAGEQAGIADSSAEVQEA